MLFLPRHGDSRHAECIPGPNDPVVWADRKAHRPARLVPALDGDAVPSANGGPSPAYPVSAHHRLTRPDREVSGTRGAFLAVQRPQSAPARSKASDHPLTGGSTRPRTSQTPALSARKPHPSTGWGWPPVASRPDVTRAHELSIPAQTAKLGSQLATAASDARVRERHHDDAPVGATCRRDAGLRSRRLATANRWIPSRDAGVRAERRLCAGGSCNAAEQRARHASQGVPTAGPQRSTTPTAPHVPRPPSLDVSSG